MFFYMDFITVVGCVLKNGRPIFERNFQGRKTKFAFPLYTVGTGTKFRSHFHCIQGKRKFRFSSLGILLLVLSLAMFEKEFCGSSSRATDNLNEVGFYGFYQLKMRIFKE